MNGFEIWQFGEPVASVVLDRHSGSADDAKRAILGMVAAADACAARGPFEVYRVSRELVDLSAVTP